MQRTSHAYGRSVFIVAVGWLIMLGAQSAPAVASGSPEPSPAPDGLQEQSDADIQVLIRQLDADKLELRQAANEQLLAAGPRSIAPLVKAIPDSSAEVTKRGISILRKLCESPLVQGEARAALDTLAHCDERSLALQAAATLRVLDPLPVQLARRRGPMARMHGLQVIHVQMAGGFGGATRRQVHAEENGRSVDISETPEQGITVTITEQVGGRPKTTIVAAANAAELQLKHPLAFGLYQRHTQPAAPPAIQPFGRAGIDFPPRGIFPGR